MQACVDGEFGHHVLATVVAEDSPALFGAREGAHSIGPLDGGIEGEIKREGLGEAVDIVIGHEANDHVWTIFLVQPEPPEENKARQRAEIPGLCIMQLERLTWADFTPRPTFRG